VDDFEFITACISASSTDWYGPGGAGGMANPKFTISNPKLTARSRSKNEYFIAHTQLINLGVMYHRLR